MLLQCVSQCYNGEFPARKNLFTFFKKLVFQNKNSMVEACLKRNQEV